MHIIEKIQNIRKACDFEETVFKIHARRNKNLLLQSVTTVLRNLRDYTLSIYV